MDAVVGGTVGIVAEGLGAVAGEELGPLVPHKFFHGAEGLEKFTSEGVAQGLGAPYDALRVGEGFSSLLNGRKPDACEEFNHAAHPE